MQRRYNISHSSLWNEFYRRYAFTLYRVSCTAQANLRYIFFSPQFVFALHFFAPLSTFSRSPYYALTYLFFPLLFRASSTFANQPIFTFHQIPNLLLNRTNFPPSSPCSLLSILPCRVFRRLNKSSSQFFLSSRIVTFFFFLLKIF